MAVIGKLRKVLADVIVQGEVALFRSQHHARCRKLLRYRANVEDRFRCERNMEFQACVAEGLLVDEAPVADGAD